MDSFVEVSDMQWCMIFTLGMLLGFFLGFSIDKWER